MVYIDLTWFGAKASRVSLAAMSLGNRAYWLIKKEQAFKVLSRAWDFGINFYDTANVYSAGRAEEILGEFLKGRRGDLVLATELEP